MAPFGKNLLTHMGLYLAEAASACFVKDEAFFSIILGNEMIDECYGFLHERSVLHSRLVTSL